MTGVIRIAEPDAKPKTHVEIRLNEYAPSTLWKLWHYVVLSKTLQTVLTVEELKASAPPSAAPAAPPPVPAAAQRDLIDGKLMERVHAAQQITHVELKELEKDRAALRSPPPGGAAASHAQVFGSEAGNDSD